VRKPLQVKCDSLWLQIKETKDGGSSALDKHIENLRIEAEENAEKKKIEDDKLEQKLDNINFKIKNNEKSIKKNLTEIEANSSRIEK